MKKFISMVMAAAMVASLVPATAFAASGEVKAAAQVLDALEMSKEKAKDTKGEITENNFRNEVPELQLKITDADYRETKPGKSTMDVTLTLDNAEFIADDEDKFEGLVSVEDEDGKPIEGTWGEEVGAKVEFTENKGMTATQVAEDIFDGSVEKDLYIWKSEADYKLASSVKADFKVDQEKETPSLEDRIATAWTNYCTDKGLVESDYEKGQVNGKDAFIRKVAESGKPDYVLVSALTVAPADKYNETEVKQNIEGKLAGYKFGTVKVTEGKPGVADGRIEVTVKEFDKDEVTYTFTGQFDEKDIITFDLESVLDKTSEGTKATVSVDSDMVTADDLVYASVLGQGITASVKKLANVAEEERVKLEKDLKIKSNVGNFVRGQEFELKLSKGFEFYSAKASAGTDYTFGKIDDNKVTLTWNGAATDEITVKAADIEIEAVSAKSGTTATMTVKALKDGNGTFSATATVEVAKVVDYKVELTVDEDEDVPVIYSGVDVDNYGITDDSDHLSLEVTAKESFPGAWSMRKGFNFELPEGVYVTDVTAISAENFEQNGDAPLDLDDAWAEAFFNAYQEGNHVKFEFDKRVFDDVDVDLATDPAELTFQLELVADPTFSGDVKLKLTGDLVDEQEVVIAKFVKPYEVKAEKNDLIIDYRNTKVPTAITITEAEAGLWAKDKAEFTFSIDRGDVINFEDDATFEVDKNSEMEIDDFTNEKEGQIGFTVEDESDEAATVTIKDMELFMNRSIPAGAYDLKIESSLAEHYKAQLLFAPDCVEKWNGTLGDHDADKDDKDNDCIVDDVCDYSEVAKEAFVNVITAGRDQDDASFTKKVVVPVGEKYIMAGEEKIDLDVPAYVSAAGYTMLPVRAVSTALGIKNDNVLWNQETRTVTILYGQRIITMSAGEKVVYVNGSAIPAAAKVEIKDDRTFLPMRDLATALGVTDITWDAATKTATLNGNQGK